MENYKDTLLSQYANSPTITGLISTFNDAVDPSVDLDNFYRVIWNVETAVGFGLDIWGKIVNISRLLQVETLEQNLGFVEAQSSVDTPQPFDQATFYNGPLATTTFALTDEAYRRLIMVKALANITDATAPNLNKLIRYLFSDRGKAFVADTGGMALRYVFLFDLTPSERAIVFNSGAISRPAGVRANALIVPGPIFGFAESQMQPFDNGAFFDESGIYDVI